MTQWMDVARTEDLENTSPHAGLPLGEGEVRGKVITCPFHGYAYRVDTGQNIDYPDDDPPARTFELRVVDDKIQINLSETTPS